MSTRVESARRCARPSECEIRANSIIRAGAHEHRFARIRSPRRLPEAATNRPGLVGVAWATPSGGTVLRTPGCAGPARNQTQSIPPARVGTHVGRKSCMSTGAYAHHSRPRDTRGPEAAEDCARKEAGPRAGATSSDEAQWSQFKLCLPFVRCDGMARRAHGRARRNCPAPRRAVHTPSLPAKNRRNTRHVVTVQAC